MMGQKFKKNLVLFILFVFPVLTYLFFASGVNNFARLPIIKEKVSEIDSSMESPVQLKNKITLLGYWGNLPQEMQVQAFNLNEIIYSRFNGFKDFQFVMFIDESAIDESEKLMQTLDNSGKTDFSHWHFIPAPMQQINQHHHSLNTPYPLDDIGATPFVYIIDKKLNLRGRDDKRTAKLIGYDARSIVELSDKMVDDVKVLLAEYRLALKEKPLNNPVEK
ncbi:MAG: hypothetical protein OXE55_02300 [Flavobacteriaceae bacterium]|nr:hypothetical protein [Flavobacteriaceae bacterium]